VRVVIFAGGEKIKRPGKEPGLDAEEYLLDLQA